MSKVHISNHNRKLAAKSLKKLYMIEFGEDCFKDEEKSFSRNEFVSTYHKNIRFWEKHTPEIVPGINEFSLAKHAICSNAIEQLKKKLREFGIEEDVNNYSS